MTGIPTTATSDGATEVRTTELDVLVITDLRFPGGTSSSLVEELVAARAAGYAVGVLHVRSPRLGHTAEVHPGLRQLLDEGVAHYVLPGERVDASLTIVKHPTVFGEPLDGPLPLTTRTVIVVAGQVPADAAGEYYDPIQVDRHVVEACGHRPTWHAVSPAVRAALRGVQLSEDDWYEVIDVDAWERPSPPRVAAADRRLVIGRHSRPDPRKWPDDPDTLRAAYPTDGSVTVRVLGGGPPADVVAEDDLSAWEVLPFGAEPAADFLAGLDAFVYYHSSELVEAFGRTILEALAVGVPVVVPPHFEPVFGPACRYAPAEDAIATVRDLLADPATTERHVREARRLVHERFSHGAHAARLRRLAGAPRPRQIGPPAPAPAPVEQVPSGLRRSSPIVVVSAIGFEQHELDAVLTAVDGHRRRPPAVIPVVVVSTSRPDLATRLGVEVKVITSRRRWDDPAETWETYAARRLRQIASHHRADRVVPADVSHPDAWIALQRAAHR